MCVCARAISFKCQPRLLRSSRGTFSKLSRNLRYNPGFPASATCLLESEISARMSLIILWTWVQLTAVLRETRQLQDREDELGEPLGSETSSTSKPASQPRRSPSASHRMEAGLRLSFRDNTQNTFAVPSRDFRGALFIPPGGPFTYISLHRPFGQPSSIHAKTHTCL